MLPLMGRRNRRAADHPFRADRPEEICAGMLIAATPAVLDVAAGAAVLLVLVVAGR